MDLGLRDRVYLVTGGSRGLGYATAEALVADGAKVVLSSRDEQAVRSAATALGDGATGLAADNADPGTPARLIAEAESRFGRLDGALISVGGPPGGTVMGNTDEQWQQAFESVFLGAVRLARTVAEDLTKGAEGDPHARVPGEERGSIAFVLSSSVRQPINGLAISNGLRPGLGMVVKSLGDELGPLGVRVNGLMPGRIATDRVRELDTRAGDPDAVRIERSKGIPLRRYAEPWEFGKAAAFVLSPAASYVTGINLPIDGGILRTI
ncbi:MAG: SDR family oxidoreductase [Streptosporangiales bacterium]|nr:SDR family oxidoreductase [Streptosporangiales bacterium]